MTREEIDERKQILLATVSVPDILYRYGIQVKQSRCIPFCHVPSRSNIKNRSAKVSDGLYYCFVCNRSMDIFDITMHFNNCDFWTAFELLGGTEKPSFSAARKAKLALKEREQRNIKERAQKAELKRVMMYITAYRNIIATSEPFSDLWCECQNQLQLELYHLEYMTDEEKR